MGLADAGDGLDSDPPRRHHRTHAWCQCDRDSAAIGSYNSHVPARLASQPQATRLAWPRSRLNAPSPARAKRFFYFHPPPPPTPPPPTYLLRGPLGRSKPDLPTYCIGSNRAHRPLSGYRRTGARGRSRNPAMTGPLHAIPPLFILVYSRGDPREPWALGFLVGDSRAAAM